MSITVLLTAQTRPEIVEKFTLFIAKCLTETRSYDGCISIDIYEDADKKGCFVFYEKWESIDAYEAYLNWRTEQGVMDEIGAMLANAPEINYYNRVDI
jgi:quinol monooxygenase YgiN